MEKQCINCGRPVPEDTGADAVCQRCEELAAETVAYWERRGVQCRGECVNV